MMGGARIVLAVAGALVAVAGVAAAAPPEHALELSRGAAEQAAAIVQDLNEQIEDTGGAPQGVDSDAFETRHEALAEKHSQHPGNAAAVHEALAESGSPSVAGDDAPPGQARSAQARALNAARAAISGDNHPGRGLGRASDDD